MSATPLSSPAVIESWEVLDLLTTLVEKSLVVYEADTQGRGRYRLLETVRQYSRDRQLERGESESLRDRHRDWFLRQSEQLQFRAWTEQEPYFAFAEREHDNLRQALEWSLHSGGHRAAGLRLAGALWLSWFHAGAVTEGRSWLEEALARAPEAPPAARASALTGLGMILLVNDPLARRSLEASVALSRETGDGVQLLAALNALGYLCAQDGDLARGKALLDEALALGRDHGEQFVVYCEFYSGLYAQLVGDDREAERLLERVVVHPRTWASVRHFALAALGDARLALGQVALARASFREALIQAVPMHSILTILKCFCGLARVRLTEGDLVRCTRLLGAAAAQAEHLRMPHLPTDPEAVARATAAARSGMGEPAYHAAFAEGRAMPLDKVVAEALRLDRDLS